MDFPIKQDAFEDYIGSQAALLAKHLSEVLGTLVSKDHVRAAIYAAYRPKGQAAADDSAEATTHAVFHEVALAIDPETLLRKARDMGVPVGRAITVFSEAQSPLEQAYATCAQEHFVSEGDLEFDNGCAVSISSEGAYVQGWKWVPRAALSAFDSIATTLLYGFWSVQLRNQRSLDEEYLYCDVTLDKRALAAMVRGDVLDDNVVLARLEGKTYARELTVGIA